MSHTIPPPRVHSFLSLINIICTQWLCARCVLDTAINKMPILSWSIHPMSTHMSQVLLRAMKTGNRVQVSMDEPLSSLRISQTKTDPSIILFSFNHFAQLVFSSFLLTSPLTLANPSTFLFTEGPRSRYLWENLSLMIP